MPDFLHTQDFDQFHRKSFRAFIAMVLKGTLKGEKGLKGKKMTTNSV
jgi:hypothetical protein